MGKKVRVLDPCQYNRIWLKTLVFRRMGRLNYVLEL